MKTNELIGEMVILTDGKGVNEITDVEMLRLLRYWANQVLEKAEDRLIDLGVPFKE